ncbi:MAG: LamG domain-containing protein, partial [Planctomycetota bacterium]
MCRKSFFLIAVFMLVCGAGRVLAGPGPVGWWRFDTGSGTTAYDSSGNNYHGSINDNVVWIPGYIGPYALNFVSGYVEIPDKAQLRPSRLTVSVWVNLSAPQESYSRLIVKGNDNSETYNSQLGGYGLWFGLKDSEGDDHGLSILNPLWPDEWIHFAAVYDGNALSLYVNGELDNSATVGDFTVLQSEGPLSFAARAPDFDRRMMGSLDDVRIYDYGMTPAEIRDIYWEIRSPYRADYPSPEHHAEGVDPNVALSWTPGEGATWHDVYLGTDFNDVNDANSVIQLGVYIGRQEPNRYPVGLLELGVTYHWRIDEAETALDPDPWKGKVWTFTIDDGKARKPNPGNWEFCMPNNQMLSWAAGPLAVAHDVYFGTDFNNVNDADLGTPDVYKGTYTIDHNYYDPGPLGRGVIYYWRVDEVSDKVVKGNVWSFGVDSQICLKVDLAVTECPDTNIIRPETAKPGWWHWASGRWADLYSHDCAWACEQFPCPDGIDGTGIEAAISLVREGDGGMRVSGLTSALGGGMCPWDSPIYDPICNSWFQAIDWPEMKWGSIQLAFHYLVPGTYRLYSYHNHFACRRLGGDDPSPVKCDLHCDVTPPMPFVGAMSVKDARYLPFQLTDAFQKLTLTDWAGPFPEGVIPLQSAYNVQAQQVTSDNELVPSLIRFATDGSPVLVLYEAGCCVCDHLHGDDRCGGRGILNAFCLQLVEAAGTAYLPNPPHLSQNVSPDVVLSWKPGEYATSQDVYLGTSFDDVNEADTSSSVYKGNIELPDTNYAPPAPLEYGQTYYWRIDSIGDTNTWEGYVWNFTTYHVKAHNPSPMDGAKDLPKTGVELCWSPGFFAASHDVYLGTSLDEVSNATTSSPEYKGNQLVDSNSYYVPGPLDIGQTYYWRIDEQDPCQYPYTWKGDVWKFAAEAFVVVEDFEDYDATTNLIYDTWLDGLREWPPANGSIVGLGTDPCDPVHGELQSMEYIYDSTGGMMGAAPYYSEAERTFSDPCNWAVSGLKILKLWFYGDPANTIVDTDQMYVGVEDSTGPDSYAQVHYGDTNDMNDVKVAEWQEWNVELQNFANGGVNLEDVSKLYLGFGDRVNPVYGGAGIVFFDDMRLYLPLEAHCYRASRVDYADYVAYKQCGPPFDSMVDCWCRPPDGSGYQCVGDAD